MIRQRLISLIPTLFFKNRPLATQLFALSAVLVSVPMLVVGIISYQQSSSVLKEEADQYNQEVLEQVKSHVEYYIRDFEITTIKILNHPDMLAFLESRTREEAIANNTLQPVEKLLVNAAFSRVDVTNIVLYVDNIGMIEAAKDFPPNPVDIRHEYWYRSVPTSGTPIIVTRTIRWPDREERVLSLIKRVHNPQTLKPRGLLIMDINFRRLQELARIFVGTGRSLYILDANGHYIYHPVRVQIGQAAEEAMITAGQNQDMELLNEGAKPRVFFTAKRSQQLNWDFLVSLPYEKITGGTADIGRTIFSATLLALLLAHLLGSAYLKTILRPLRRLHSLMKEVEVGNLKVAVKVESQDEIGGLSAGFNKMVARLNKLVEEIYLAELRETQAMLGQRETEMKALQAQVNPHFIGNSLETIRGMAMEKGIKDIASMAGKLGLLLQYNLRQGLPLVTISEEIKYLEIYLEIQKCRFGDIVNCELDIPEWALQEKITRFSLQPLVENCFTHGINERNEKMKIVIAVVPDGQDAFWLHIRDTGGGMDPERLAEMQSILDTNADDAAGHIGIANVHRRTFNLFGSGYGIRLSSSAGGTTASIRLPRHFEPRW